MILFASASYFIGARAIYKNKYYPSIYTRVIWLLTSINAVVSVLILHNNFSVILFALLGLGGSAVILFLSLKKSKKIFGTTELICTILLMITLLVWIFADIPLLNLSIGLLVVLIGGIPTIKKVIKNPRDEDFLFWFFFAIASLISLIGADKSSISGYLYPLAIACFDSMMTLLCLRRYLLH